MPTYTCRNKKTGKEITKFFSISEMEEWSQHHKNWEVMCGTPAVGYTYNRQKPDNWFRDRLREMKKKHPGSTINVP